MNGLLFNEPSFASQYGLSGTGSTTEPGPAPTDPAEPTGSQFFSNAENWLGLAGAAGTAAAPWLSLFGGNKGSAAQPVAAAPPPAAEQKTGSNSLIWIALVVILIIGIVATILILR